MFSATDIASFLACRHTAILARAESKNEITKPFFKNQTIDLLRTLGLENEQRYLRELAGVYWEWSKEKRKFVISCGVTGTILYYPRPLQ